LSYHRFSPPFASVGVGVVLTPPFGFPFRPFSRCRRWQLSPAAKNSGSRVIWSSSLRGRSVNCPFERRDHLFLRESPSVFPVRSTRTTFRSFRHALSSRPNLSMCSSFALPFDSEKGLRGSLFPLAIPLSVPVFARSPQFFCSPPVLAAMCVPPLPAFLFWFRRRACYLSPRSVFCRFLRGSHRQVFFPHVAVCLFTLRLARSLNRSSPIKLAFPSSGGLLSRPGHPSSFHFTACRKGLERIWEAFTGLKNAPLACSPFFQFLVIVFMKCQPCLPFFLARVSCRDFFFPGSCELVFFLASAFHGRMVVFDP